MSDSNGSSRLGRNSHRDGVSSQGSLLAGVDTIVGNGVEAAVRAKHRWRLRRLGWSHALLPRDDGPWAAGDPRPRDGCSLEVLIDGAEAFPAIADAIERARGYVHLTGWHVAPYFELVRGERPGCSASCWREAADRLDVKVLVWAGAPVPAFHPDAQGGARGRREPHPGYATSAARPIPREHPFHCHHEKTVIVDGEVAFVGGIDMTDYAGDRFDTSDHPARRRLGWHDVGTRIRGPAVADVDDHFALRWRELTGEELERPGAPAPAGEHTVQVVRTIAERHVRGGPRTASTGSSRATCARSTAREIHLPREPVPVVTGDRRGCSRTSSAGPPCDEFRLVILLPAQANNGHDDTMGQLGVLAAADDGAGRLLAATIRSLTGERDDRLYVHAKVGIVDDRWLTVGSANLNAHSLLNDTEMNVVTDDPELARDTRLRLWSEHLSVDVAEIARRRSAHARRRPVASDRVRAARAAPRTGRPPRTGCSRCPASPGAREGCSGRSSAWSTTADANQVGA